MPTNWFIHLLLSLLFEYQVTYQYGDKDYGSKASATHRP